jgi:hypothetical protein
MMSGNVTAFPNGISAYGMMLGTSGSGIPPTTGTTLYVSSVSGASGNAGTDSSVPMATIKQAVALCTASKGDVIVVMPGHTESITSATTLDVNVAGVRIIGLGHGRNRPVLNFTNTAGKVVVSAANVLISGIVFTADVSAVVTGVSVTASDVTFENCEWDMVDTGDDFAIHLLAASVSRLAVRNCRFYAEAITGSNAAIQFNAVAGLEIVGCIFDGFWVTSILNGVTAASTRVEIHHNKLRNVDTTAGLILTTFTASLGLATNNMAGTLYSTNITAPWVNTGVESVENYIVNVVTETGGISPAVAST